MTGAETVLAVNIAVALLFAAGYAIIALANPSQRRALLFAAGYLVGMLEPVCDFLTPFVGAPDVLEAVGFIGFLLATLSISATFSIFHRQSPPWMPIILIFGFGVALRAMIWSAPRETLVYGIAYQLPYFLASALAIRTVLITYPRRSLHLLLAGVFGLIAATFMVKPFLAVALGPGATFADYTKTVYALLSQATTGILLLAAGVVLLLIVAQKAISESELSAETDPLSGLANRRGFDRLAQEAVARATRNGLPISVAMFDLDHFKAVNDTHGHDVGDAVIAAFATLLRAPGLGQCLTGRQGGEEFAVLMEGATAESARLAAEGIRARAAEAAAEAALPATTVSGGVAQLRRGEGLSDLMRRADQACYQAKRGGRNRICLALSDPTPMALVGSTAPAWRRFQREGTSAG